MSSKLDERVLVVPSAELDRLGRFQGFSPEADRYLSGLLVPELIQFLPRSKSKTIRAGSRSFPTSCFGAATTAFCYTRGKSQGEARLHRLRSLGVGGHVSEEDAEGRKSLEAYESAMRREIDEEVEIKSPGSVSRVGLINDDSTPVGQVHLGVVHLFELEHPRVLPREEGLAEAEFLPLSTVWEIRKRVRNLVADLCGLISAARQ